MMASRPAPACRIFFAQSRRVHLPSAAGDDSCCRPPRASSRWSLHRWATTAPPFSRAPSCVARARRRSLGTWV